MPETPDTPSAELADRAERELGVHFSDKGLLVEALTHSSYDGTDAPGDYERLEFLGDALLDFLAAEHLFLSNPDAEEGRLTKLRTTLVSGRALAVVARDLDLGRFIRLGRAVAADADTVLDSILAGSLEALLGALYLDAGLDATRTFFLSAFSHLLDAVDREEAQLEDPKSALQEASQARDGTLPAYRITTVQGPPHERTFTAEVSVDGRVLAQGSGGTKQDAERAAAAAALRALADSPGKGVTP